MELWVLLTFKLKNDSRFSQSIEDLYHAWRWNSRLYYNPPCTDCNETLTMATTATAASASVGGGGGNVLSDKVSRALHVRTDTPAMRAALDALARLPDADGSTPASEAAGGGRGGGGGGASAPTIDAKSVRAAIEGDALRRALAFQSELRRLAADASELRRRVGDVAGV
ncbi:hypothetical protein THAOC_09752, partial [Thalassiosira oceanica]